MALTSGCDILPPMGGAPLLSSSFPWSAPNNSSDLPRTTATTRTPAAQAKGAPPKETQRIEIRQASKSKSKSARANPDAPMHGKPMTS